MGGDSQHKRACCGHPPTHLTSPRPALHLTRPIQLSVLAVLSGGQGSDGQGRVAAWGGQGAERGRWRDGLRCSRRADAVSWSHLAGRRCAGVCAGAPCTRWSPQGLLFSLTQVTFQPFPLPSFFALPSDSAKPDLGVGGQRGREHPTTFSGQPLTSGHPSSFHSASPPRPPAMLQLGLTLLSCGGTSAMSSCGQATADGGSGYTQAPHPGWGLCLPGGGAPFLVCTEVVAPLAVRRDFSPLSVPIGVKKPDWGGHQGSK